MLLALSHYGQQPIHHLIRSISQKEFSHPPVVTIAFADKIALLTQTVDDTADLSFVEFSKFDYLFLCCRHVFKQNQQHAPMRQRHTPVTAQQIGGLRVQVGLDPRQPKSQECR